LTRDIMPEFLDTINYAVCQAANEYLGTKTPEFFKKVGEYHLEEALKRGFIRLDPGDKPLNNLIKIAKYLESTGYMERIRIGKVSESEAIIEMFGVSVTKSSVDLLNAGKHPSHYMTNIMIAALQKLGIVAELRSVDYDEKQRHFREHWKIL
jgi:ABC-type transport system substrate-binding protein